MDCYELFDESIQILQCDITEDSDVVEKDCFSYTSGHYTKPIGTCWCANGKAICRALVRLDDQCIEEMDMFDVNSPSFLFDVTKEFAIAATGNFDPAEKLLDILTDRGYDDIEFDNFRMMNVRKLANNHYLVQFYVEFESENGTRKQQQIEEGKYYHV